MVPQRISPGDGAEVLALLNRWPSAYAIEADIRVPVRAIYSWRRRGYVPGEYWLPLVEAAKRRKIDPAVTLQRLAQAHRDAYFSERVGATG